MKYSGFWLWDLATSYRGLYLRDSPFTVLLGKFGGISNRESVNSPISCRTSSAPLFYRFWVAECSFSEPLSAAKTIQEPTSVIWVYLTAWVLSRSLLQILGYAQYSNALAWSVINMASSKGGWTVSVKNGFEILNMRGHLCDWISHVMIVVLRYTAICVVCNALPLLGSLFQYNAWSSPFYVASISPSVILQAQDLNLPPFFSGQTPSFSAWILVVEASRGNLPHALLRRI